MNGFTDSATRLIAERDAEHAKAIRDYRLRVQAMARVLGDVRQLLNVAARNIGPGTGYRQKADAQTALQQMSESLAGLGY